MFLNFFRKKTKEAKRMHLNLITKGIASNYVEMSDQEGRNIAMSCYKAEIVLEAGEMNKATLHCYIDSVDVDLLPDEVTIIKYDPTNICAIKKG